MSRQEMTQELPTGWASLRTPTREEQEVKAEQIDSVRIDLAKKYDTVFGSRVGLDVLKDLISVVYGAPQYDFKSPNCNEQAAFNAGQRNVVDMIHAHLNYVQKGPKDAK